jgi:hypothetical protein
MEMFCELATLLDEELPEILLFSVVEGNGVSMRLQGVRSSVHDSITWNVADWELE